MPAAVPDSVSAPVSVPLPTVHVQCAERRKREHCERAARGGAQCTAASEQPRERAPDLRAGEHGLKPALER